MKKLTRYRNVLISVFFLFLSFGVIAQNKDTLLSSNELMTDFKIYKAALEEAHAGLYLYINPCQLNGEFEKIDREIKKPMSKNQFYTLLLKTTASLKHGHTFLVNDQVYGINYVMRDLIPSQTYLPFTLKIINNKVYIAVACFSGNASLPGSQIMSINGIPTNSLLVHFQRYVPADGGNISYKNFKLQGFLFHHLFHLLYPTTTRYKLVCKSPNGHLKGLELDGITPELLEEKYKLQTGHSVNFFPEALEYKLIDPVKSIGYLKVLSFYEGLTNHNGKEFTRFIDSAFQKISGQKVKKLIIDVRDNEGGNDYLAILLFSYLTNKSFAEGNPTYLKSDTISFLSHIENPNEDIVQFAHHPSFFEDSADGQFILKRQFDELSYAQYPPKTPTYNGSLFILINGGCFSATTRFINSTDHYLHDNNRIVKFVGEDYGGDDLKGFATGGENLTVLLPKSHIKLNLPLKEFTRLTSKSRDKNSILNKKILQDPRKVLEDVQLEKVIKYARDL